MCAENPQETAECERKLLIFAETSFSHLLSPFWRSPTVVAHRPLMHSERLEMVVTVSFKKHCTGRGTRFRAVSAQGWRQVCLEFQPPRFGKSASSFSRGFPSIFLGKPRKDPRNCHSLLEFSDLQPHTVGQLHKSIHNMHVNSESTFLTANSRPPPPIIC